MLPFPATGDIMNIYRSERIRSDCMRKERVWPAIPGILMFCTKCGKELQEGTAFCTNCGAAVMGTEAAPKPEPQAPAAKVPAEEFVLGSAAEVPAKKKFSPKILIPIVIVAVVIAAVVAVILNWGAISRLFGGSMKPGDPTGEATDPSESTTETVDSSQMSDAEYMRYVESQSAGNLLNAIGGAYGTLLQPHPTASVEAELHLGDDLLSLLEESYRSATGENMDFSFLSYITLRGDGCQQGSLAQSDLGLLLGNTRILTLNVVMDTAGQTLYLACPELNDDFLMAPIDTPEGMVGLSDMSALLEALPDENTLRSLLGRYIDIVFANLDKVTRTTETLELDGLKQDCTVLTVRIGQEDAWKAAKAVLNEAKEDPELKELIETLGSFVNAGNDDEPVDAYQAFTDWVQNALEELDSEDEFDTESYFDLITYVDGTDTVIGRELRLCESGTVRDLFSCKTVTSGDEFRFELVLNAGEEDATGIRIDGAGTVKDGTTDGTYTFSLLSNGELQVMLNAQVSQTVGIDSVSGTMRLEPTAALLRLITFGGDDTGFLTDLALELEYNSNVKGTNCRIQVYVNDVFLAGLKLSVSYGTVEGEIRVPDNAVDVMDQDALMAWMGNLSFDEILSNLEKAGVPQQLLELLANSLSSVGQPGGTDNGF